MCGICGVIDYNRNSSLNEDLVRRMCNELRHRGPDDEGVHIKKNSCPAVGLGHRRLSIIDLSTVGHQPMSNENGTIWLVFNGEVYNYRDLRQELEGKGHIFKSNTDTETVIHLYEEYKEDCVKHIRGMFAFAIWDEIGQTLLLARDRVGKKPLLYTYVNGVFCFASEFLALLESGLVKKDIYTESIHYYLTFGYIPAPLTIYNNVFKLMPAHILILKNTKITLQQYWRLDYAQKINISEDEAAGEVLRLLKEAVKIRLYSDVPLGAFLSGGIDSSTVVGLMSELSSNKVKTFSIGFEERDYSELRYARNIAEKFDTEHHEFIVNPKALEILPLLLERYGEPYADSSCIPTYYVCQQTKRYVTVALNGDGGDESFAGYERYQAMLAAELLSKSPFLFKYFIQKFSRFIPDSIEPKNKLRRIRRFFDGAFLPVYQRYLKWIGIFDDGLKKEIYSEDYANKIANAKSSVFLKPFLNDSDNINLLDRLLNTDVHNYLPNDLLAKVDITSMANSLEARSPFLDHKLMEFAARLPSHYKLRGFIKKYILKKAIKDYLPHENIHRKKMGFGVPVGRWFRAELKGLLMDTVLSESALKRGYFKPESIKNMVNYHIEGKKDYTFQLWTLLMLELWYKRFID